MRRREGGKHFVSDPGAMGREQAFGCQSFEAFDHHRTDHLDGGGAADFCPDGARLHVEGLQRGIGRVGVGPGDEQGRMMAQRMDRRHDREIHITPPRSLDDGCGLALGAGCTGVAVKPERALGQIWRGGARGGGGARVAHDPFHVGLAGADPDLADDHILGDVGLGAGLDDEVLAFLGGLKPGQRRLEDAVRARGGGGLGSAGFCCRAFGRLRHAAGAGFAPTHDCRELRGRVRLGRRVCQRAGLVAGLSVAPCISGFAGRSVQYVARWQRQHLTKAHALACRITICHHYCGHAQPLHCRPIGV